MEAANKKKKEKIEFEDRRVAMMEKEAMQAIIEEKNKIMRERSKHHQGPEPPSSEIPGAVEPIETKKVKKKNENKKGVKGKKRASKGKKKKEFKKRTKKSGISKKKN